MSRGLGARAVVGLVLGGLVLLEATRYAGADEARRRREIQVADSAAAAVLTRVSGLRRRAEAARARTAATEQPVRTVRAAADRQFDRVAGAVAIAETARAAAEQVLADSSASLRELRVELRRSADAIAPLAAHVAALQDTLALERAAVDQRIAAVVAEARALWALDTASLQLDSARVSQVDVRDEVRKLSWWRRALRATCPVLGAVVGTQLGTIGGEDGAVIGAGVAALSGKILCR